MKTFFLIILNGIFLTALYAQRKGQARIDSLLKVIQTTKQDSTRIKALNAIVPDFIHPGKMDSAMELAASALELAKKINDSRGQANAYFNTGQVYAAKQNANEALKNFSLAISMYEHDRNQVGIAEAANAMGIIHQRTNYEEALRMFKKSLAAAQQAGNKNLMGRAASNIANTLLRAGDYHEAAPYNAQSIQYYTEAGNETGLANGYVANARILHRQGNFQQALKDNYAALRIYEKAGIKTGVYNVYIGLGLIYEDQKNYDEVLNSYLAATKAAEELGVKEVMANAYINLGNAYRDLGRNDEALKAFEESLKLGKLVGGKKSIASAQGNIGTIYSLMGRHTEALESYGQALKLFEEIGARESIGIAYFEIGSVYFDLKKNEESKEWLEKALQVSGQSQNKDIISKSYLLLMKIDSSKGDFKAALERHKLYISYRDSIANAEAAKQLIEQRMQYAFSKKEDSLQLQQALIAEKLDKQTLLTKQQQQELRLNQASLELARRQKDLQMLRFLKTQAELQLSNEQKERRLTLAEQEKALQQSQLEKQTLIATQKEQTILLKEKELNVQKAQRDFWLAGTIALFLLSFFVFRNYRNQRKANANLQKQQAKTEQALKELKATQAQLIQSEKMASLGVLTAGIAHEIQNPLNFVNNFSEINNEILDEMKQELQAGKSENVMELVENIKDNNEKINEHGKRADAIVKGMLQHSRASTGKKEPVDINALADEYLRLSFHGLRAKDKNFQANYFTKFDTHLDKISVVPQEIGRVLMNLYNNAFYAVTEKKKNAESGFEPTVWVTTKNLGDRVEISVRDNGTGIPKKAIGKLFQPFFTTKPTGQGTGLGLSLSYDIIKAHGGAFNVETGEGEFSEFIIQLPIDSHQQLSANE